MENASPNAMSDLRATARAMISTGYGRECVAIYKTTRKSIVYEGLCRLGFEHLTLNKIQKLDWGVLELKIRYWLATSGVAVRTLFAGERILCDHVFDGSDAIRESCFADIAGSAAVGFLGFAESVAKTKKSPEKLFRILDMFSSMSGLWMDIESVFCFDSTSAVRAQALTSLMKLAEAARATVSEFESAVQKDGSKAGVPGGGIHPLTRYAMNYIVFLADYEETLADVYAGIPLQMPPLPESFLDSSAIASVSPSAFGSGVSLRFAWLLVVLLCKLDGKAELYKEPALSYLFLANNLQYMIGKVSESRLGFLLGSGWVAKHAAKARHYAASYERIGWARVAAAIPTPDAAAEPPVRADGRVRVFYERFEEAVRVQREWVVADPIMKAEMRSSVAELLVPAYREFYDAYRPIVAADVVNGTALRFAPEDVMGRVMELFSGSGSGGSGSTSGSDRSWSKSLWWSNSH
ncbi:exocyst complex component EXO70A1-like [Iris pallida]|uniref:Exocyst subunit Exo70 family protein n=1 Tax=Iris pallida TaxID=29817 RepID=A0AAX6G1V8_IRIPA|nr:exocyst complex component EXO70A1-like [Iris pallida]